MERRVKFIVIMFAFMGYLAGIFLVTSVLTLYPNIKDLTQGTIAVLTGIIFGYLAYKLGEKY